jgi:hypothetical protein
MEGTGRQGGRVVALTIALIVIATSSLAETALAAADREGQARVLLRSVVSRAAFRQILGMGFDLPVTLRACPDQSSTMVTYDTVRSLIQKQSISYSSIPKMRQSLCYPYHEQAQVINSEETRFLFKLPAEHCPAIKDLVKRVLDDLSGREFETILNRPLQSKVNQLFTGARELFPNTSGLRYWPYVSFTVGECASGHNQSIFDVTMKTLGQKG